MAHTHTRARDAGVRACEERGTTPCERHNACTDWCARARVRMGSGPTLRSHGARPARIVCAACPPCVPPGADLAHHVRGRIRLHLVQGAARAAHAGHAQNLLPGGGRVRRCRALTHVPEYVRVHDMYAVLALQTGFRSSAPTSVSCPTHTRGHIHNPPVSCSGRVHPPLHALRRVGDALGYDSMHEHAACAVGGRGVGGGQAGAVRSCACIPSL